MVQEPPGHKDVKTTIVYIHVPNGGLKPVRGPLDECAFSPGSPQTLPSLLSLHRSCHAKLELAQIVLAGKTCLMRYEVDSFIIHMITIAVVIAVLMPVKHWLEKQLHNYFRARGIEF